MLKAYITYLTAQLNPQPHKTRSNTTTTAAPTKSPTSPTTAIPSASSSNTSKTINRRSVIGVRVGADLPPSQQQPQQPQQQQQQQESPRYSVIGARASEISPTTSTAASPSTSTSTTTSTASPGERGGWRKSIKIIDNNANVNASSGGSGNDVVISSTRPKTAAFRSAPNLLAAEVLESGKSMIVVWQ